MTLTVSDFFCGAGGSSSGLIQVPGLNLRVAANHWSLAVEVHAANHTSADHVQADLSQYDPRYFPRSDLGWFSPSCTHHSIAQGKAVTSQPDLFGQTLPSEAAERSRATMDDVSRFTEHHRYQMVMVENVVEVTKWVRFPAWWMSMELLGYEGRVISLNSMHAQLAGVPAPQSRDRVYIVWWRKDGPVPDLDRLIRPRAVCPEHGVIEAMQSFRNPKTTVGKYRSQYVYRCPNVSCRNQVVEPAWLPALTAIDLSIPAQRIGDRAIPLKPKTMARIQAGIDKFWGNSYIAEVAGNTYDAADPAHPRHGDPDAYMRVWPTDEPLRTLHTTNTKALVVPVEGRDGKQAQPASNPLRTMTTRSETALAVPCGGTWNETAYPMSDPMRTRTTRETEGVAFPFIAELRGGGSGARSTSDPLATVTASGNHHGLITTYNGKGQSVTTDHALPTVTTVERHALLMRNNTPRSGDGAEMTTPIGEPMRTLTTTGHQSLLQGETVDINDVYFRMLEPSEIAAGMAFDPGYKWLGTRRERVRLAGNAVTPPCARDIGTVVAEALL